MELKIVEFETAKKLKEIGFDLPVDVYYFTPKTETHLCTNIGVFTNRNGDSDVASAPTQALVIDWLREVHDLEVVLSPFFFDPNSRMYDVKVYKWSEGNGYDFVIECGVHSNPEKALESGIPEAIKLIKTKQDD